MVDLTINGESRAFDRQPTIEELLESLDAPRDAVAVEVNRTVVPRAIHAEHRLKDGDTVEIVTFVGGG